MRQDDGRNKLDIVIESLATGLLVISPGDRLRTLMEYSQVTESSSSTIRNAFYYLENNGIITVSRHGQSGSFVEAIDYPRLQSISSRKLIAGIFPPEDTELSKTIRERMATLNFAPLNCPDEVASINLVSSGRMDFAIVGKEVYYRNLKTFGDIDLALDGKWLLEGQVVVVKEDDHVIKSMLRRCLVDSLG